MVLLPVHLLPSPPSGSQLNGQQRSHPSGSSSPAPVPVLCQGSWEMPGALPARAPAPAPAQPAAGGTRAPACPRRVLALLREMMLLVLASDVTPCKSPDQRRWACAACVWHGTFSSFLCIFNLEAIMCFSLGFLYRDNTVLPRWSKKCSSLVLVVPGRGGEQ